MANACLLARRCSMAAVRPVVTKEESVWVIRLQNPNGKTQEYRCATESQARQLAMVFAKPDSETPQSRTA
jgi:capsular polysaccharide biosynthesis protein